MDHHVLLSSNFLLKIRKAMCVHIPNGQYLFRYNISVIQTCLMSLLGLCNTECSSHSFKLAVSFISSLVSPASQSCDEKEYSLSFSSSQLTAEKENIKKVHPSLVQVPAQYTAICSRDISPGCSYMVNLICHYQQVQMKAVVPFQNTNGNIYTDKW